MWYLQKFCSPWKFSNVPHELLVDLCTVYQQHATLRQHIIGDMWLSKEYNETLTKNNMLAHA